MKAFKVTRVILVLAGVLIFATQAMAAKKHYFDGLTGSWRGKGFVTTSVGAKEEAIRCRLRNRNDEKKPKLILSGNCSIGGVLIPMTGWIQQVGKSKKYTASLFKSLGFLRIDSFIGRLSGRKLKLNFKGKDRVSKENISAFVTIITRSKDRFEIRLSSTDVNTKKLYKVGTIKFARK